MHLTGATRLRIAYSSTCKLLIPHGLLRSREYPYALLHHSSVSRSSNTEKKCSALLFRYSASFVPT